MGEEAYFLRAIPNTFSTISTGSLPDGISVNVTHSVEHMGDDEGTREVSYNSLIYDFEFPSGRRVAARVYLDHAGAAHILNCTEAGASEPVRVPACTGWPEFRQATLTLMALDYRAIEVLGIEGYEAIDLTGLGTSDADVDEWIARCTKAAGR